MDDLTALREFGSQLAPDDLEPPAALREHVLSAAKAKPLPWYRRQARPLALLGAAAATCAVIALPSLLDQQAPNPPAKQTAPQCQEGHRSLKTPAEVADLLYLPSEGLTGPNQYDPAYALEVDDCTPATATGTWYSLGDDGFVDKRLTIAGPNETDPSTSDDPKSEVTVNGQPGTLYYHSSTDLTYGDLYWQRPDGTQWNVHGEGLTRAQIVAAAESIVFDGREVQTGSVPTGLTTAIAQRQVSSLESGISATFAFGGTDAAPTIQLAVGTDVTVPWEALVDSRAVSVNGTTGWVSALNDARIVQMIWQPADGVVALMMVRGTPEEAVALARSTTKVGLDDPRVNGH